MRWAIGLLALAASWACLLVGWFEPNLRLPWIRGTLPFEYLSVPFLVLALVVGSGLLKKRT